MNNIRRASLLKSMVGGLLPHSTEQLAVGVTLVQSQAQVEWSGMPGTTAPEAGVSRSLPVLTIRGVIAQRNTSSTTGFTDVTTSAIDPGSTYGHINQTSPFYHPSDVTRARLYRATAGGYIELNLSFFWAGNPGGFITQFGTGCFVRYTNRAKNLQQIFPVETVGTLNGTNTIRFTASANLGQQGEAVGDVVSLELFFLGG